jgi:glycosyltransferase involved in cell wall biosynthesis
MNVDRITPLVLTFNEAPNIGDTLNRLRWARRIVVVDSFSSDETIEIAERFDNVTVAERRFDDHVSQWNFGLQQIETEWVLALDADYHCPPEFADEVRSLGDDCDAYVAAFTYCVAGKPLRGTLYPPRAVLFRPARCHYVQDGHTQLLVHDDARTGRLKTRILHNDRKPLSRWLTAQTKYVDLEVEKLLLAPVDSLSWKDRLRKNTLWAPLLTMIGCLFRKGLILDGWPGVYYTAQRVYVELLLLLKLLDARLLPRDTLVDSRSTRPSLVDAEIPILHDRDLLAVTENEAGV